MADNLHLPPGDFVDGPGVLGGPEAGRAVEELDVDYPSEPLEIGFNARYLLDRSLQIEGDEIEFAVADSGSPTLVRDPKDDSALYVLMPMRV